VSPALAYNGLALDRVLGRRDAPEWIEAVLARPASRVIPFWRDGCLVRDLAGPRPVVLGAQAAAAVLEHAAPCVFLGLDGEAGVFAAD
jgi:NAD+ diphosphatase